VEQNGDLAMGFCDRVYVLRLGAIATEGQRGELGAEELRLAYFGS
jgi:ABC-type branched-subunit amino acid transport system ATPase component